MLALALGGSCKATSADTAQPELATPSRDLNAQLQHVQGFLKEFDNGLTLFVAPDPYTRLVQFDVRHQVGSREDPKGKAGMAHFVEHLMFQMPVEGPGSTLLMSDLPQHSLSFNAYTAADQTHYMHTGTADELERYFKYTKLRLEYDCDAVAEDEFLRERDVVRNEHRWRGQGLDLQVYDAVTQLIYPEGHPYRRAPLAGDEETASINPEDACAFIGRYYVPNQTSIVVAGDVDPAEVLELAKKYIEPIPAKKVPPRPEVGPPVFSDKTAEVKAAVKKPTAVVLFKMPKRFTPQYAASQAALQTMAMSIGFFADRHVVKKWYLTGFGGEAGQVIGVAIEIEKARELDRAINEVVSAINRGFSAAIEGKEYEGSYDQARQSTRLQVLSQIADVTNRGNAYAEYLEQPNGAGFLGAELAQIDALDAETTHEIGRKIFNTDKAMIIKIVPDGTEEQAKAERAEFTYKPEEGENLAVPDDVDPAEAHKPLTLQNIAPPDGQTLEFELENGMKVVLVQSSQVPVMDVQVIIGGGTVEAGNGGVAAEMAQRAFGLGQDREVVALQNYFDMAGLRMDGRVGAHATSFFTRGLSINLDFMIAGVSNEIVNSEYRTSSLENWKQGQRERLKKKSYQMAMERENLYSTALYGKGHPHERHVLATNDELKSVKLKDIETFRDEHYRAANSAIIITGGFDMNLVTQYVQRFFGDPNIRIRGSKWNEPKVTETMTTFPEPKPGDIRYITQVDAERVMTDVRITYPMGNVFGKDHAALMVLSEMLNFEVGAVRKKLGASYGIYAFVNSDRPQIAVGGAVDGARSNEGYQAIKEAIDVVRKGDDFDRLFAFARRNVLQSMVNAQANPETLARRLAQSIQYGLSYDYYTELARQVATLKPEQVKAQIDKVLVDDKAVTMFLGPKKGIDDIIVGSQIVGAKSLPEVVHDEDD
jgi:zinc protease